MRTIRGRLTIGYAIALSLTLLVFAATIYFLQPPQPFRELDARLRVESDLIANLILESSVSGPVLQYDSLRGSYSLGLRVSDLLQTVEDYVVVVTTGGGTMYATAPAAVVRVVGDTIVVTGPAREESPDPEVPLRVFEDLAEIAAEGPIEPDGALYQAGPPVGDLRYVVRPVILDTTAARIVAAAPAASATVDARRLVLGMLVSGPLILIASTLVGYFMAGRTMTPVDTIIDEIEAITDGRSLHRRVLSPENTDELARLSSTLNNMLVRLERSFSSLHRFTADASHELKTPLTVLRSGVERAITHPKADPEVLAILEETLVEANRMTELVDSLLMLARTDEGRAPLHLEVVDMRDLLQEVFETAQLLGEQTSVHVTARIPEEPLELGMDRGRMHQLLMNLVTNAIKYTPSGGSLTIEGRRDGSDLIVAVQDTGIGIASSELPQVFDRFWRADIARSRTGDRPGVGLGLAICKWIAEAHGGSIAVESRRGVGTTFTVRLPMAERASP